MTDCVCGLTSAKHVLCPRFYIIKEGSVALSKVAAPGLEAVTATLGEKTFFGERALLKAEVRWGLSLFLLR